MADVVDHPLGDQEVGQLGQAPGRERQVVVGRSGQRDPGEVVTGVMDRAPGNGAPLGGIKVVAENGWFAARPSGTEDLYRIYAESFQGAGHLRSILRQAQDIVDHALGAAAIG